MQIMDRCANDIRPGVQSSGCYPSNRNIDKHVNPVVLVTEVRDVRLAYSETERQELYSKFYKHPRKI